MGVLPEDVSEEGGTGGDDDFMGRDLAVIICEGHVKEVLVMPAVPQPSAEVGLIVVPSEV